MLTFLAMFYEPPALVRADSEESFPGEQQVTGKYRKEF